MASKSRSIGGIYASLSLRDGGFKAGLKSARKNLNDFGGKAIKGAAVGAAGLGTAMAAGAIAGTKHTLSMVDDLNDLANQTGVGVAAMMKLQRAYKDGGREAEMTGKDIGKMQKSIVTAASGGTDPFAAIGLSAEELLRLNPADQFDKIGGAIMRIANPAERTAKAMEIFGKGGMGLTTVFEGLPDAEKALGNMPALAQQFAGAMGEANDLVGHLPIKSDQFFVGFTAGIIGELLPNLQKVDDFDFTKLGQNLGRSLAAGLEGLTDGTVWEVFAMKGMAELTKLAGLVVNLGKESVKAALYNSPPAIAGRLLSGGSAFYSPEEALSSAMSEKNPFADVVDQLGKDADTLTKEMERRAKTREAAAAAVSIKPPIVNPITGLSAAARAATESPAWQAPTIKSDPLTVNSYQRRGLSLDGGPDTRKVDKQTDLLTEMRNHLKKLAEDSGGRFW